MFKELAVIGTTASGKSALALRLAQEFSAAILSLDSLSVYKEINIASAKPTPDEIALAPHFGIDEIYPNEPFSAGLFFKIYERAKEFAERLDRPLIIVGGSGFYLKAMLSGLTPEVPKCAVPRNDEIYELARKIDPEFAEKFSQSDSYRLEKWYQIYAFSGAKPSEWLAKNTAAPVIKNLPIFEILLDTRELRERIVLRTRNMLQAGLLDEAKFLFEKYGDQNFSEISAPKISPCKPLNSIGLKECGRFLRGEILSERELENLISTHTAQLAKRQRTFNRSQFSKIAVGGAEEISRKIEEILNEGKR